MKSKSAAVLEEIKASLEAEKLLKARGENLPLKEIAAVYAEAAKTKGHDISAEEIAAYIQSRETAVREKTEDAITNCPPGRSARRTSESTRRASPRRAALSRITSNVSSRQGISSIRPAITSASPSNALASRAASGVSHMPHTVNWQFWLR